MMFVIGSFDDSLTPRETEGIKLTPSKNLELILFYGYL